MLKKLIAVVVIAASSISEAQVRVVESSPRGSGPGVHKTALPPSVESDVYSQIRSLQEEIAILRGLIEEQAYEIKQLKQLQLDNYIDLDRRLSSARSSTSDVALPPVSTESSSLTSIPAASTEPIAELPPASEDDLYKIAYDLLNQRQHDASAKSFKDYLKHYPQGKYASNSYYWLGKIAMSKTDYPEAKTWFNELLTKFPDSAKVSAAKFDIGRVHFYMGDKVTSKSILNEVAASNSDASGLAQKFLSDNF
jgi:tol-pal system protein YbgF